MPEVPGPILSVDPDNPTPPYEQVRRQIAGLVATGVLREGDRLPPLRQLARDLGLAVGTVGRAYAELEAAGVLVSRRGAGTRIAAGVTRDPAQLLDSLAADFLAQVRQLGFDTDDAVAALRRHDTGRHDGVEQ